MINKMTSIKGALSADSQRYPESRGTKSKKGLKSSK